MTDERKKKVFDLVDDILSTLIVICFIAAWGLGLYMLAVSR